ncbi:probable ATP-dependent RNA helicase DDX28 [Lepeophtheirus salmonis]|uniref:probable ATP-dependent RNA helicase DDX28 n=1 Tax=Lepeophtheirus salmonis TaxID=72036 RepID=UPI001AE4FD38|nr:probable ATP-dependent RNA helicase DDX28 [Lepeophtheirus salmonis]
MINNKIRIKVPTELQRRATKLLNSNKYREELHLKTLPLLIKCPYHPHHLNQIYSSGMPLSSSTWSGRKSIGRKFEFMAVNSGKPRSENDFSSLGLDPSILSTLKAHNFKVPTNIQALSIPQILENDSDILIASETGNGKTLSFLLPIVQKIINSTSHKNKPYNSPRVIIAVPSRELALQIYKVSKIFQGVLGIRSHCTLGGGIKSTAVVGERFDFDILVSTLGALNKHLSNGYIKPHEVRHLVFDEADTLLDDTFSKVSSNIISIIQKTRRGSCQIIFSGATMPRNLNDAIGSVLDIEGMKKITTNSLHRVPIHIKQKFIRTSMIGKFPVLLREIEKDVLKKKKILIFSNKAATSIWLEHALAKENIPAISFSQHSSYKSRHERVEKFLDPLNDINILTATDLGSRGLDFDASLSHVVNFDFPFSMSDYIHRIGRVGRVSSEAFVGRVTNLVCTSLQIDLVQKIEKALRLNTNLPNVNSNIIRILQRQQHEKIKNRAISDAIMEEMDRRVSRHSEE